MGVGKTICFLLAGSADRPAEHGSAPRPLLDVQGDGVTLSHLTVATWDHLPGYALHWRGAARPAPDPLPPAPPPPSPRSASCQLRRTCSSLRSVFAALTHGAHTSACARRVYAVRV